MALLARQLYFEAVKVGDELPPLVKPPVDRTQIARYAGASGDFNPLHVDEHLARNAGFPSALAPAMLGMGFIAELVVDWLRGARLRRYSARFVKIVWPGDVLTCRGRVVDRRFEGNGVYAIDLEVWTENQKGELVVKGLATAQLYYSAEDDARQRAGQPPLVVTPQEEEAHLAKLSRAQSPRRPEPRPPPAPPPRPPARPAVPHAPQRPAAAAAVPARGQVAPPSPRAAGGGRERAAVAQGPSAAQRARPPAARRPERPAAKAARGAPPRRAGTTARPSPRPPPKAKPAARASRPRGGSKPTGKKRR